jgi:uncharacterized protein
MKPTQLPLFDDITESLEETELKLHASQVHGLITGVLCGNFNEDSSWLETVMGEKVTGEPANLLQELYLVTNKQLVDVLMSFQMVLPDDNYDLPERAEALTVWCQGFLTGLKVAGIPIVGREPSELTEAIDDLVEIAKMNYQEVVASEEDEDAYAELVEYVRMAVILIFTEIHTVAESPSESSHLH